MADKTTIQQELSRNYTLVEMMECSYYDYADHMSGEDHLTLTMGDYALFLVEGTDCFSWKVVKGWAPGEIRATFVQNQMSEALLYMAEAVIQDMREWAKAKIQPEKA